jgi:hypothetical protein
MMAPPEDERKHQPDANAEHQDNQKQQENNERHSAHGNSPAIELNQDRIQEMRQSSGTEPREEISE